MSKVTNDFSTASNAQGPLLSIPSTPIVPFPVASMVAKPLAPERLTLCDALVLYVTSLYELNKLVILAVYSFFESLFHAPTPSIVQKAAVQSLPLETPSTPRPSVIVPFQAPESLPVVIEPMAPVKNPVESLEPVQSQTPIPIVEPTFIAPTFELPESTPEDEFDQQLYQLFPSLLQYEKDQLMPTVLSRYLNTHLFKDKQQITFDPETKIFTLTFPSRKEVPMVLGIRIKDQLRKPKFCLAQTVKVKIAEGKLMFLDDSLTLSCSYKANPFIPEIDISATVQSLADPDPFYMDNRFEISIKLNGEMNPLVKRGAQALCALFDQDLNRIVIARDASMRLLHQALYPQI